MVVVFLLIIPSPIHAESNFRLDACSLICIDNLLSPIQELFVPVLSINKLYGVGQCNLEQLFCPFDNYGLSFLSHRIICCNCIFLFNSRIEVMAASLSIHKSSILSGMEKRKWHRHFGRIYIALPINFTVFLTSLRDTKLGILSVNRVGFFIQTNQAKNSIRSLSIDLTLVYKNKYLARVYDIHFKNIFAS